MPTIVALGLGKQLRREVANSPSTVQSCLSNGIFRRNSTRQFWALRDVGFSVSAGQSLGVVGDNGAGKSTLLRLLGGVGRPDEGTVSVLGRVGALLSLGAGFHGNLTGRENAYINGTISGLTRREIAARFDAIVGFAGLSASIDSPLRTYSSGMQMRLAFSIAIHTDPDVLLIDEVLAVGDLSFQQKCITKILELRDRGCATVLVSHDTEIVRKFCDQALWLHQGQVKSCGPADRVVQQYLDATGAEPPGTPAHPLRPSRIGTGEVEISEVEVLDANGNPTRAINAGEEFAIRITWISHKPIARPIFGVAVTRFDGLVLLEVNTQNESVHPGLIEGSGYLTLQISRLDLNDGGYFIDAGVYAQNWECIYDDRIAITQLLVNTGERSAAGTLNVPHRWVASA